MPKANLNLRGIRKDEENKEKARVRKNTITHRCSITFLMVIHDRIFMNHCRYRISSDWYEEMGNHEMDHEKNTVLSTAECDNSGTKRSIEKRSFERTRSYGDIFDLSMEPAVEFMEYDRPDEYLESTVEPEPAVF